MNPEWHARLREAVQQSGRVHKAIAFDAGIAPETLSRILHAHDTEPRFVTVVGIIHAAGETVGWLLAERGYEVTERERHILRSAATITLRVIPDEMRRS